VVVAAPVQNKKPLPHPHISSMSARLKQPRKPLAVRVPRMSVRVLRVCCPRSLIRTCPHSLFAFETPRAQCSVPKDHLLVRQMGLTKLAAVCDCRRHERAWLCCVDGVGWRRGHSSGEQRKAHVVVRTRRVPLPARGDRRRGALVSALGLVLPRCRGAVGRAWDRRGSREGLPLGAEVHGGIHRRCSTDSSRHR
jgi:hypothetical protein